MWDKLLETLEKEWPVIKKAPRVFGFFLVGTFILAFGIASWSTQNRIDILNARVDALKETVERYKLAAGLAQPSAKTSFTDLSNAELKTKAMFVVSRIREIISIHERHLQALRSQLTSKELSDEKYAELRKGEMLRASNQFSTIRVDAVMLVDELRDRLPIRLRERVVIALPHFKSADSPDSLVSMHKLMPGGEFAVIAAGFLVSEIEELSKLLPDKLGSE